MIASSSHGAFLVGRSSWAIWSMPIFRTTLSTCQVEVGISRLDRTRFARPGPNLWHYRFIVRYGTSWFSHLA